MDIRPAITALIESLPIDVAELADADADWIGGFDIASLDHANRASVARRKIDAEVVRLRNCAAREGYMDPERARNFDRAAKRLAVLSGHLSTLLAARAAHVEVSRG